MCLSVLWCSPTLPLLSTRRSVSITTGWKPADDFPYWKKNRYLFLREINPYSVWQFVPEQDEWRWKARHFIKGAGWVYKSASLEATWGKKKACVLYFWGKASTHQATALTAAAAAAPKKRDCAEQKKQKGKESLKSIGAPVWVNNIM